MHVLSTADAQHISKSFFHTLTRTHPRMYAHADAHPHTRTHTHTPKCQYSFHSFVSSSSHPTIHPSVRSFLLSFIHSLIFFCSSFFSLFFSLFTFSQYTYLSHSFHFLFFLLLTDFQLFLFFRPPILLDLFKQNYKSQSKMIKKDIS